MQVTYYSTEQKRRPTSREPVATVFDVPQGSNLVDIIGELIRHKKPLAVHIWIDGLRVGAPSEATRAIVPPEDAQIVVIQDLSGDAFTGLSWLACTETEETE